jgi:diguanylate cyclase (GGDEF)-like protein/PAS domain S-box-containing protein
MVGRESDRAKNDAAQGERWSSRDLLAIAGQVAHVAGWVIELPEKKLLWSEEIHTILEFPPDVVLSLDHMLALSPPSYREKMAASLARCVSEGTSFDEEFEIRTAKGRMLDVRMIGEPVRDEDGRIIRIEGAFQDITEKKRAAEDLIHSQQRFRQLADAMPQIVWTADPNGALDYISQAGDEYTGMPLTQGPQERWMRAVHPGDAKRVLVAWKHAISTGTLFLIEYRLFNDASREYRWHLVRALPIRDDAGCIIKWYGTATDIHDRRLAEEQVRNLAGRLTTTLDSITDAFFTLDREWHFTYLNKEAERVLQRERGSLLGKSIWDEFSGAISSDFFEHYHRALEQHVTVVFEAFFPPLGAWLEVRAYPSGEGLAVYFRDVTEQKRAAMELQRTNRALQMLSRCNEALIRAEEESDLLHQVCRIAVEIGGYRLAWAGFRHDDDDKSVRPVASVGTEGEEAYLEQLCVSWSELDHTGAGPVGRSIRSGAAVICSDLESDPTFAPWREMARTYGFRGVIALPLREAGHTFGVLVLYANEVLQPSMEEVQLLQELANDLAFGIAAIRSRLDRRRLESAVLKVAAGVSASTGKAFFEQLVSSMTDALGAQIGAVARLLPGEEPMAQTMAVVRQGRIVSNFTYRVRDTVCQNVMDESDYALSQADIKLAEGAQPLEGFVAKAYVGRRLDNSDGQPVGLLFVLFEEPLKETEFIRSTLRIFAARAAAELERLDADSRIRSQASLLDQARDAIIVRGMDHRVLYWNKGAESLYGWRAEEALGRADPQSLYADVEAYHAAMRAAIEHGEWSGELWQRRKDGNHIIVEARWTLVRDEDGQPHSIFSINTDITERKTDQERIYQLAFFDPLTRLPNRQLLQDRIEKALNASGGNRHYGVLMLLDLDNFKSINDTAGHETGDKLLQEVARRLQACVPMNATVARFGGDEFVILLETSTTDQRVAEEQARRIGDKVLRAFQQPYQLDGYEQHSSPSIGITLFAGNAFSAEDLFKRAELAMYQAKAAGRNTKRFFDPDMQAAASARAALEADFRRGLRQGEFLLYYQPQVDSEGRIAGTEALVRWHTASRGSVSPAQFIPLAEDTGLILHLGRWVLEGACRQLAEWSKNPKTAGLTVAVNVSARQFHHPEFVTQVMEALEQAGADPHRLKLELTESLLVNDMEDAIAKMGALKEIGLGFSLDDFGTGYSSLAYLKRLPLDQLKIDQSFVRDVLTDPNDAAIARTIVALGQTLGLSVIAEGVEMEAQRNFLAEHGCHAYQGYLFSQPLTVMQFEEYLDKWRSSDNRAPDGTTLH